MRNIFYLFFIIFSLSTTTMSQAKDIMLLELKYMGPLKLNYLMMSLRIMLKDSKS